MKIKNYGYLFVFTLTIYVFSYQKTAGRSVKGYKDTIDTKKQTVIQFNIKQVLDSRSVTTFINGKTTTWHKGVDHGNGYLTVSAALQNGDNAIHALPDNPLIPGNAYHPDIQLNYKNSDTSGKQTRVIADTNAVLLTLPKNKYTGLYLSLTSAYGPATLRFDLIYTNGTVTETCTVPDWWKDLPVEDTNLSYVIHNAGKWDRMNKLIEKDHHNIDALKLHPDRNRVLKAVKIQQVSGKYLVFWAATGVIYR